MQELRLISITIGNESVLKNKKIRTLITQMQAPRMSAELNSQYFLKISALAIAKSASTAFKK